jgi:PhoH-like ATPase
MQVKEKSAVQSKIFVLDTSVILHDHAAFKNFQEHDVAIPIQVLEELDNFKNGNETRNFEARSFIRIIDDISNDRLISDWLPIGTTSRGKFKIVLDEKSGGADAEAIFGEGKFDHRILNAAIFLKHEHPDKKVILVSKDICLRLKAKALDIYAEDYETGKVKNLDQLYTGSSLLENLSEKVLTDIKRENSSINKLGIPDIPGNHFLFLKSKKYKDILAFYSKGDDKIYTVAPQQAFNISSLNPEQSFAMHALLNPDIKLVTIQGNAGTGKTLLALACALEQRRDFRQILVTRPIVPLSNKDIGFLPGDIKSKVDPYMTPIWDNLKYIRDQFADDNKTQVKLDELVDNEKIAISPLAFIRGRTLTKVFFIVDEAQNLTPHEVKTIISRAGEGTKVVFTGDIYQIDTPYLDSESNGLSYLIDKAKSHALYAHITLQKGERSELANLANELL